MRKACAVSAFTDGGTVSTAPVAAQMRFAHAVHRLSHSCYEAWPRYRTKIVLDKVDTDPYATASMSSPLVPEMLTGGANMFVSRTERGDY